MDHWNPRLPDPRNPWLPEYRGQQTVNTSNKWSPEYWDRQSINSRDGRSPEYWDRQSIDSRDVWSPEYWDRQPSHSWRPAVSSGQQPTYPCDPWSHKYSDQHPIGFKNSRSQGYYQQIIHRPPMLGHSPVSQTIHRPPLLGHSPVSHATRFPFNSCRNDSAFHPYRRMGHMNSYHQRNYPTVATRSLSESSKDSAKKRRKMASAGNRGNLKAVSVNVSTTKPALIYLNKSNTASNAANNNASKQPKDSLPVQVEKNDASEDVLYLYSVGPNEGKLVELVDLSENSQVIFFYCYSFILF